MSSYRVVRRGDCWCVLAKRGAIRVIVDVFAERRDAERDRTRRARRQRQLYQRMREAAS